MFDHLRRLKQSISFGSQKEENIFDGIIAQVGVKEVVLRSVLSPNRTKTLLIGAAASAKSLFLRYVCEKLKGWIYFDASNASGPGLIDVLYENQDAAGICIDELDKMSKKDQATLYNFLESGEVVRTLRKEKIRFSMPNCKVIASSNSSTKLAAPLKSRFLVLSMKAYNYDEFLDISENLLKRYNIPPKTAREVGDIIWNVLDSKDVRMIDHIGSRINPRDTESDIERFVKNVLDNRQIEGVDYN